MLALSFSDVDEIALQNPIHCIIPFHRVLCFNQIMECHEREQSVAVRMDNKFFFFFFLFLSRTNDHRISNFIYSLRLSFSSLSPSIPFEFCVLDRALLGLQHTLYFLHKKNKQKVFICFYSIWNGRHMWREEKWKFKITMHRLDKKKLIWPFGMICRQLERIIYFGQLLKHSHNSLCSITNNDT